MKMAIFTLNHIAFISLNEVINFAVISIENYANIGKV